MTGNKTKATLMTEALLPFAEEHCALCFQYMQSVFKKPIRILVSGILRAYRPEDIAYDFILIKNSEYSKHIAIDKEDYKKGLSGLYKLPTLEQMAGAMGFIFQIDDDNSIMPLDNVKYKDIYDSLY